MTEGHVRQSGIMLILHTAKNKVASLQLQYIWPEAWAAVEDDDRAGNSYWPFNLAAGKL